MPPLVFLSRLSEMLSRPAEGMVTRHELLIDGRVGLTQLVREATWGSWVDPLRRRSEGS